VTEKAQEELSEDINIIRLSPENISQFSEPVQTLRTNFVPESQVWNYKVGAGDVLNITVFEHPELQLPASGTQGGTGFQVQANGTFNYPYVGEVTASGRTPELIRAELAKGLEEYIPNPQVQVRVAGYNSQSVIVSGKVNTPNSQPLTSTPLTVLTAINAAGGLTERADRGRVKLQRRGKTYNINLDLFLAGGGKNHNPILISGDLVSVPQKTLREAYVLGQVSKPAPIDLTEENVNLTQAITRLGGLNEKRADARGVFVFRNQGVEDAITVFQLETSSPTGMLLGTNFQLVANDVVYVTRAPISKWNDIITQLLPSIGVSSTIDEIAVN
jgi:polysaccharide export outer membrane protein